MLNELQWGLTMTYMAPSYAVKEMLESARSIASDFTWMGSQGEVSVKPHAIPCPHMPAYARNTSPKDFILCVGVGSRPTAVVMGPGWCCPMHADIWRVHPRYKWYILNHTDTVNYCYSCFRNLLEAVNPRWLLTWSVLLNSIMQWEYGLLLFLPSRCIKPKARLGTKHCVKCDSWLF